MTASRVQIRYRSVALVIARASFDPRGAFGDDTGAHVRDLVVHLCQDDIASYVLDPDRPQRLTKVRDRLDEILLEYEKRAMIAPLEADPRSPERYLFAVRDDDTEEQDVRAMRARLRLHDRMLACLRNADPTDFERLCGKLLDHIGCTEVHVTRSSVDLGADFLGRRPAVGTTSSGLAVPAARRVLTTASQLLFGQAKRYAEDNKIDQDTIKLVEPTWQDIVRRRANDTLPDHLNTALDDLGYQAGDAPIWMFATTSSYTPAALNYAINAQMQTLDGDQIAQLMLQDGLGVKQDPATGDWSCDDDDLTAFCA